MNQDRVKDILLKLHDFKVDFVVIFSGKKNKKINGLYKIDKNEIIIHNRNFINADGKLNKDMLLYTAIHEAAHHIQYTELKQKSARAHTSLFYATLDDLVDIAEKKGLYKMPVDEDTQKLIDEAKNISCEIAAMQRKLGKVLRKLHETCEKKGIRYDDVIERKAQISRQTEKRAKKAHALNIPVEIGADIQEAAVKERDEEKIAAIVHAGQKGKSIDQAKKAVARPINQEDDKISLLKEKIHLERTIDNLKRHLEEVVERLRSKGGE
ncbi:MAG: hypothetical protein LBI67_05580 [Treponema sp.]|jgi:hypothetical protein|nr:hypothetical protein [Treponema sp.]